jgi:hypothetical protein
MVGVGVGGDDQVERLDAQSLQVFLCLVVGAATVDQDVLSGRAADENRVPWPTSMKCNSSDPEAVCAAP